MEQVAAIRSREEIEDAIRAFTPADFVLLSKVAGSLARYPLEPQDLLQTAYVLALTTRKCKVDLDVKIFLIGIMRSVAHGERVKAEKRGVSVPIADSDDPEDGTVNPADTSANIEENLIIEEKLATIRECILSLFEVGSPARDMAEGIMEGLEGEDLRVLLELDQRSFDSMRRLFRRRVDKAYPGGWRHDQA